MKKPKKVKQITLTGNPEIDKIKASRKILYTLVESQIRRLNWLGGIPCKLFKLEMRKMKTLIGPKRI